MTKTVLIVDDSDIVSIMVATTLRGAGYEVIEATDGQDGLEKAMTTSIDLVITDQNMPRMNGLTLIRNLRAMPDYINVPIIMLTILSDDSIKHEGKVAGATCWLGKTFDPKKLLEVTKKLTG